MTRSRWLPILAVLALVPASARAQSSAPPRPDHVVLVIEENHSAKSILGSSSAPYIHSLITQGASFSSSFAISHPSQPNYLALFSGSTQGVTNDVVPPPGSPFSGPNLGSELIAAGLSFTGYSEDQPSAGYTGANFLNYARRHNPWVDFSNVPPASNLPWSSFPSSGSYASLPTVSIVVPNVNDDMHDGTIAQGDSWLQSHLDAYIQWAQSHNSLFILTWDEDDYTQSDQILTLMVGPMVKPGVYSQTINHYSVLRTIEDLYGLSHAGAAASATPIEGVWTSSAPPPPPPSPPPPSNQPPTVALNSPADQATFTAPASITLTATASDPDGTVTRVDFLQGTTLLGSSTSAPYSYSWTGVGAGNYILTARATDNGGLSTTSTPVHVTVSQAATGGTLPAPWQQTDVGAVGASGSAIYDSATGSFSVGGSGTNLFNTLDAFHFVYQPLTGDGSIVAQVGGLGTVDPWANAGIMIRDGLAGNAIQALLTVTVSHGVLFQTRSATGLAPTSLAGSSATAPHWLKLTRTGSTVTASESADGQTWTTIGSQSVSMPATVSVGLVVADHLNAALDQASFASVQVTPGAASLAPPTGAGGGSASGGSGGSGGSSGCGLLGGEAVALLAVLSLLRSRRVSRRPA
jgi:hypothetical protein